MTRRRKVKFSHPKDIIFDDDLDHGFMGADFEYLRKLRLWREKRRKMREAAARYSSVYPSSSNAPQRAVSWIDANEYLILPNPNEIPFDETSEDERLERRIKVAEAENRRRKKLASERRPDRSSKFQFHRPRGYSSEEEDVEGDHYYADLEITPGGPPDELEISEDDDLPKEDDILEETPESESTEAESPRENAADYETGPASMAVGTGTGNLGTNPAIMPDPDIRDYWNNSADINELNDIEYSAFTQLRMMLGIENISMDTLTRYNVRIHTDTYDQVAILYPRYRGTTSRLRTPLGLKVIRKVGDRMEKENYPLPDETLIRQRFSGIFGYHLMTNSDHRVVLTTNERDAMAVYEATGMLTFALPMGERLDQNVIPYLEDFDQIYLWFPHRHADYAKDWGYALNGLRCFLIKSQERPIELIRNGNSRLIKQTIRENAVRMRDKGFRSMTDIRDEVKADLVHNSSRLAGFSQWKRFAILNRYLGGFRPGELTVLTGGTGYGKTTFLCEYSLDLFVQGVRTLFCSFEMQEEKILKWMLVQYAG
ncbi:hypothetical protein WR25_14198 [Diploscapter pachys]|uniref:SF4 helicase domain-containing protein n=1 Tax=Diploscapter pachys TaxID=2018661 RepID=A0A2A2LZ23_9BILA|nr:hypothetical protein WR25_14198 [Diploscapter pachys]